MILQCTVHGTILIIEGKKHTIQPPPGSYGYPCRLVSDPHPTEGEHGGCQIVELEVE